MHTISKLTACTLLMLSGALLAGAPLSTPSAYKICDYTISYCAYLDPDADIKVYELDKEFNSNFLYTIEGWHRSFFLSRDGDYAAVGYWGLNLVTLGASEDTVILTFYRRGKKTLEVKLGEVLISIDSLQKTASHYHWGQNHGFNGNGKFVIETVEAEYLEIDPATGRVSR